MRSLFKKENKMYTSFWTIVNGLSLIILVIPFWHIFKKIGFPRWWALLILIPFINIVLLFYVAFSNWPNIQGERERQT